MVSGGGFLAGIWCAAFAANLYVYSKIDDWTRVEQETIATLQNSKGKVHVRPKDLILWQEVSRGQSLHEGETISTGEESGAILAFSSGQVVQLGPESQMTIEKDYSADATGSLLVTVLRGRVEAKESITPKRQAKPKEMKIVSGDKVVVVKNRKQAVRIEKDVRNASPVIQSRGRPIQIKSIDSMTLKKTAVVTSAQAALEKLAREAEQEAARLRKKAAEDARKRQLAEQAKKEAEAAAEQERKEAEARRLAEQKRRQRQEAQAVGKATVIWPRPGARLWTLGTLKGTPLPVQVTVPDQGREWKILVQAGSSSQVGSAAAGRTARVRLPIDTRALRKAKGGGRILNVSVGVYSGKRPQPFPQDRMQTVQIVLRSPASLGKGPILVGLFDSGRSTGSGWLADSGKPAKTASQQIILRSRRELSRITSMLKDGGFSLARARVFGRGSNGVFIARSHRNVAFLNPGSRSLMPVLYRVLGGDIAYQGDRNALMGFGRDINFWKQALKTNSSLYAYAGKRFVPINSGLFERDNTTLRFVRENATAVFSRKVQVLRVGR